MGSTITLHLCKIHQVKLDRLESPELENLFGVCIDFCPNIECLYLESVTTTTDIRPLSVSEEVGGAVFLALARNLAFHHKFVRDFVGDGK